MQAQWTRVRCACVRPCSRFFNRSTSGRAPQSGEPELADEKPTLSSRPHTAVDRIIRVSHAGEFGADRIYAGQAAVLGNSSVGPMIKVIEGVFVFLCPLIIQWDITPVTMERTRLIDLLAWHYTIPGLYTNLLCNPTPTLV